MKIGSEMKLNLILKVDEQLDDAKKTGKKIWFLSILVLGTVYSSVDFVSWMKLCLH